MTTSTARKLAFALAASVAATASLALAGASAIARPVDRAVGSWVCGSTDCSSTNYIATIKNTGAANQLHDYIAAPAGVAITGCGVVEAPAGTSCNIGAGSSETAAVDLGSGGLPVSQQLVVSLTTSTPIACGTALSGGVSSAADPGGVYTTFSLPNAGSCGGGLTNSNFARVRFARTSLSGARALRTLARVGGNSETAVDVTIDDLRHAMRYSSRASQAASLAPPAGAKSPLKVRIPIGGQATVKATTSSSARKALRKKPKLTTRVRVELSDNLGHHKLIKKQVVLTR